MLSLSHFIKLLPAIPLIFEMAGLIFFVYGINIIKLSIVQYHF